MAEVAKKKKGMGKHGSSRSKKFVNWRTVTIEHFTTELDTAA